MKRDKRKTWQYKALCAIVFYLVFWFYTVVYASTNIGESSISITQIQFWIICVLLGIVQGLISYIYISGIKELKYSIRKLFEEVEKLNDAKLSKEDHDRLCKNIKNR